MTADELREKVAERFCESSSCVHFCKNFKKMPNGKTCLCGVDADAAIRVVIEAAMQKCTNHAEYMRDMKTPPGCDPWVQQEIAREWDSAALQISTLLSEEQQ